MLRALLLFVLFPAVASAQGFPTQILHADSTTGVIRPQLLNADTLFVIDTTGGHPGIYMPPCSSFSTPRSFGATKTDPTSNFVQFFVQGGDNVHGATYFVLTRQGQNITIGCDTVKYFVMAGELLPTQYMVQRTPFSTQYPTYYLAESDRNAVVRYNATTETGKVCLTDTPNVSVGYIDRFDVKVFLTRNSVHPVEVCAPSHRSLNGVPAGCITITTPGDKVKVEFDSAEFETTPNMVAVPTTQPSKPCPKPTP